MKPKLHAPADVLTEFDHWQCPKRGTSNPEVQTNPVWTWLMRTKAYPHAAHAAAGSGEKPAPGWCFDRFGQTQTELPDGTIIFIGGEHEDHYDPDFYIYNDVVVQRPDGSVEFFGYPEDVFPPTDFHSATLCGDETLIIGGLRYPKDRLQNTSLVYRLQLSDFSIQRVETQGTAPNWLHDHNAELDMSRQSLVCSGGNVTHTATGRVIENLTTWGFDLSTNRWSATSTQSFHCWLLVREDESFNELRGIECVVEAGRSTRKSKIAEQYKKDLAARGHVVDPKLHAARFTPPIPHKPILATDPFGKDFRVHRLEIQGVIVRIREDMHEIAVTVEGDLPADILADLQQFGVKTYSAIEGVPYKSIPL